jgi:hypothetical protein
MKPYQYCCCCFCSGCCCCSCCCYCFAAALGDDVSDNYDVVTYVAFTLALVHARDFVTIASVTLVSSTVVAEV